MYLAEYVSERCHHSVLVLFAATAVAMLRMAWVTPNRLGAAVEPEEASVLSRKIASPKPEASADIDSGPSVFDFDEETGKLLTEADCDIQVC